jgi:ABC-type polysaccharide/polyol phosphate export permease
MPAVTLVISGEKPGSSMTPLTFLGGSFYSVNMLPSGWRTITLLNPVVYLISGFRWSFYEGHLEQ